MPHSMLQVLLLSVQRVVQGWKNSFEGLVPEWLQFQGWIKIKCYVHIFNYLQIISWLFAWDVHNLKRCKTYFNNDKMTLKLVFM